MASLIGNCRESCATCPSIGTFNRLNYDNCAYDKKVRESTSPLQYNTERFKYENCNRCTANGIFYAPFDLVNQESELRNITRANTRCPTRKYNPGCKRSATCQSTYDKDVPVVYPPDLCPVVCTNLKQQRTPGYMLRKQNFCDSSYGPAPVSENL
ncbi:MAG: hypothetical protein Hyperionvirus33_19 [Hyperionvirus sp.]|uniref:Uncharacterized protein n=1 Tax=Hyperionvirus sp. TaxID=2487770 RepID=A0A3G5ABU3_9VIRU|nr:MAG: hypothetical protein Hyperionvirus33_19 [Hyperionvirus sp.]